MDNALNAGVEINDYKPVILDELIFNLSSQIVDQSNQLSTEITEVIVETVEGIVTQADADIYKLNHMVKLRTILGVNGINKSQGYSEIEIITPISIVGGE